MNLGINSINLYNQQRQYYNLQSNKRQNITPAFQGYSLKAAKNMGYMLIAAGLLSLNSCNNTKTPIQNNDDEIENKEYYNSASSVKSEEQGNSNQIQKSYHYFPKNDDVFTADQYDWVETIYPDGSIIKDSLGYKIYISSDGKRTEVKTEQNEKGMDVITTTLPDGTKIIRQYMTPQNSKSLSYEEKTYYPNGKIKEKEIYNEYLSDSLGIRAEKTVENNHYFYNEKEILVKWKSNLIMSDSDSIYNKYDEKKRLVYDNAKKERYLYKGNNVTPYQSVSELDDCKRITLYTDSGTVNKVYFQASDGTVTEE